jgi:hypothetical protein
MPHKYYFILFETDKYMHPRKSELSPKAHIDGLEGTILSDNKELIQILF